MIVTFQELRELKDKLPNGSMKRIADELGIAEDTVRNYFGGTHYKKGEGKPIGIHIEQGADGGVVRFDDDRILELAIKIANE